MAQTKDGRMKKLNVNMGRLEPRISWEMVEAVKQAMLAAVPAKPPPTSLEGVDRAGIRVDRATGIAGGIHA